MKLNPEFLPTIQWETKKELERYISLTKLVIDDKEKPYHCTLCNAKFLTPYGADNHVRHQHIQEARKIVSGR